MTNIKIRDSYGPAPSTCIIDVMEKLLGIKFPESFREVIELGDGVQPFNYKFEVLNPINKTPYISCIGAFLSFYPDDPENIVKEFFDPPENFPKKIIPIADVGNGDLICFDYSIDGFEDPDPPVVYWLHENPEGKDIAYIGKNFDDFMSKLRPSDYDLDES